MFIYFRFHYFYEMSKGIILGSIHRIMSIGEVFKVLFLNLKIYI